MLTELFTSQTRIKLLLKLFLNPDVSCYLRELAREFSVSSASMKEELDSLSQSGYMKRQQNGRSVFFRANTDHPFFPEIHSIVKKYLGIDKIVHVLNDVGEVEAVYILDDYALGKDSGLIDVLVVGNVNKQKIEGLRGSAESKLQRQIRVMVLPPEEFKNSRNIFLNRPNWKII
ncbi:MAG: ArsR family transcriptional regulator [Desulfovermiculus sp.]